MSAQSYEERILRWIGGKEYRPQTPRALARHMGISDEEYGGFRASVKEMARSGRVVLGSRQAVMLPEPAGRVIGTYRGHRDGFGFVTPDAPLSHGDLYIPRGENRGAVTGDTVAATVRKQGKRDGVMMYAGRIEEIVQRGQSRFVGQLLHEGRLWFVQPDGKTLHAPIFIDDPGAKNARAGDQVVVEMLRYPAEGVPARGVLVEILGKRGEPGVDTLSIIRQFQLPEAFPETVLAGARAAVAEYDGSAEAARREDLSNLTVITIDPDDARDFDDAISLTTTDDGMRELGVHIADVSYFVKSGEALDVEAHERATSVYLPGRVIPMLPEVLSNGLCSLQENEARLTKSAFLTYDSTGRVVRTRFANTMIRSAKRLTYQQATSILKGKTGRCRHEVTDMLRAMERLARDIRARRLRNGMLVLDLPAAELVFNDEGAVTDVVLADTSFSHTLIEMFMVEANEAVARKLMAAGVPHLRRIHPSPEKGALEALRRFLMPVGIEPPVSLAHHALQRLLDEVRGTHAAFAVHLAVLKSMASAEYSPAGEGHFALASDDYLHFTSPIRRYPDLTVHRFLNNLLADEASPNRPPRPPLIKGRRELHPPLTKGGPELFPPLTKGGLGGVGSALRRDKDAVIGHRRRHHEGSAFHDQQSLGRHCTSRERRAEAAERELRLWKILRLLASHVGDDFTGVVTGVANIGLFVQLDRYLVDGLIRLKDLADDWWDVDIDGGCVIGERSGMRIALGDEVTVRIVTINDATRQMDLALVAHKPFRSGASQPRTLQRRRGKTRQSDQARRRRSHAGH